jgi:hypothetical protein
LVPSAIKCLINHARIAIFFDEGHRGVSALRYTKNKINSDGIFRGYTKRAPQ